MNLDVKLGIDLSAYATVVIDVDDGATREQIIEAVKAFVNSDEFEDILFDVNWESRSALRIVNANDGDQVVVEDEQLEPSPYDAGVLLQRFLSGGMALDALVRSAGEVLLLDDVQKKETWRRTLKVPGAAPLEVSFTCRAAATAEERDVAFVRALAAVAQLGESQPERKPAEAGAEVAQ